MRPWLGGRQGWQIRRAVKFKLQQEYRLMKLRLVGVPNDKLTDTILICFYSAG
jgi:hypothetical protein